MDYSEIELLIAIVATVITFSITIVTGNMSRKINRTSEKLSKDKIDFFNILESKTFSSINDKINEYRINIDDGETKKFDDKIEELIQNHHEQAIRQSVIQFWFSLIASVVGFVFIIVIVILSDDLEWYEYIIKILPGAIIESVSVLFFSQSKETRERASDFLNRLREDRQFTKSIAIIDTLSDEKLKSLVKAEIALHLCGINDIDVITEKIKKNNIITEE